MLLSPEEKGLKVNISRINGHKRELVLEKHINIMTFLQRRCIP